tara:strand:+ start:454 stop:819 length:366 start_codon:yes stop_codon:yes gene_type:complete
MAATVTLYKSPTTVTLPAPSYPEEPGNVLAQKITQSMSGRVMSVTRASGTIINATLHFNLNETQYNALDAFITSTIIGAKHTCVYTNHEGVAFTSTYLGGMPGMQSDLDNWNVALRMHLVP